MHIWKDIVRPTLIDTQGWGMFGSATRAGSGFNQLCKEVDAGKRPGSWKVWHWRTQDNPKLPPEEFEELKVEYPIEDISGQQELLALLLDGIAGLAFPEFVKEVEKGIHVVPTRIPPRHWRYAAFLDWGFVKGCYGLAALGPEGQVEVVYERILAREHAKEAAQSCLRESSMWPMPQSISYDVAMDYDAGLKQGSTLTNEWISGMLKANGDRLVGLPQMIPARHSPGSRAPRKNLFHQLLKYADVRNPATGLLEPWALPKLRIQQQCKYLISTLATIPLDERNPEDVACFVAGTMVTTKAGQRPIESVKPGEVALTPVGWRRVTAAHVSGRSPTVIVTLANGTSIEGTPNHKVFVEGLGLVELQNLCPGLELTGKISKFATWKNESLSTMAFASRGGREGSTILVGHGAVTPPKHSTDRSGWTPTDPFQQASASTTSTTTRTTTPSKISRLWTRDSTPHTTCDLGARRETSRNWLPGVTLPQGRRFSERMLEKCLNEHPNADLRAPIVESLLRQSARATIIALGSAVEQEPWLATIGFARSAARHSHGRKPATSQPERAVISVVGSSEKKPVYNLTVEQAHLYYANGCLVTNTKADDHGYDALGYLLVTQPEIPRGPEIPQTLSVDQHPGYDSDAKSRKRTVAPWERQMREKEEAFTTPNYWTPK